MGEVQLMLDIASVAGRRGASMPRSVLLALLVLILVAATAAEARATVDVTNHNDPAGDPTVIAYRLTPPPPNAPIDFVLHDGEYQGFGKWGGTVVVQVLLPADWEVEDIQCSGTTPQSAFAIDKANGSVTINHGADDEQYCSFTNRRKSAAGGASSGVSPSPPPNLAGIAIPDKPALLHVKAGRRYADATIRITRRSVIKSQLLWRGHVVGTAREVRKPGTYDVTVSIRPSTARRFLHQGRKRVTLTLRVVVVASRRPAHVFRYRVVVPLS
jgi:hypothetical protein